MYQKMVQLTKRVNVDEFFSAYPLFAQSYLERTEGYPLVLIGNIRKPITYAGKDFYLDYELKIKIPDNYPLSIPNVFIVCDDKIVSFGADGHFMDDQSLCLGVVPEVIGFLSRDCSLRTLMDKLVVPFLAGLEYWKKYNICPYGERSHGAQGYIEYFKEKLGLVSLEEIDRFFEFLKKSKKTGNKKLCPFGCGVPYGKCQCKGNLSLLKRQFPPKIIEYCQYMLLKDVNGDSKVKTLGRKAQITEKEANLAFINAKIRRA